MYGIFAATLKQSTLLLRDLTTGTRTFANDKLVSHVHLHPYHFIIIYSSVTGFN